MMMIDENYAYIAVRDDGFVDGACFTESEDAQQWCADMRAEGMTIEVHPREQAKAMLFTHKGDNSVFVA